jgi:hypothetical protein
MNLFVPARQSVRFGAPLKAKAAALNADAAQPAETMQQRDIQTPEPGSYQELAAQVAAQASEMYEEVVKYVSSWVAEHAPSAPEVAATSPGLAPHTPEAKDSVKAHVSTAAPTVIAAAVAVNEPPRVAQIEPPVLERATSRPNKGCCIIS